MEIFLFLARPFYLSSSYFYLNLWERLIPLSLPLFCVDNATGGWERSPCATELTVDITFTTFYEPKLIVGGRLWHDLALLGDHLRMGKQWSAKHGEYRVSTMSWFINRLSALVSTAGHTE